MGYFYSIAIESENSGITSIFKTITVKKKTSGDDDDANNNKKNSYYCYNGFSIYSHKIC